MQSEHERYLVEQHFKKPVILTDYPKEIKAFYMKQNDDGKTVRAMDVFSPKIGEIIGGSQREEDFENSHLRAASMGVPEKDIWWYLDTRRFGTAPHSGFGLGSERLLLFVTGMTNIRDVIPFRVHPKMLNFNNFENNPKILNIKNMENLKVKELEQVVVRFAGDSGDGRWLTGSIFRIFLAIIGNEISTFRLPGVEIVPHRVR